MTNDDNHIIEYHQNFENVIITELVKCFGDEN